MLSRVARRVAVAAIALALPAVPAWAAQVTQVRIGNHPNFTRVVFELDAPSGYRIERRTTDEGGSELLVTLDAGSTPRSLESRSVMVERVAVQDGRDQAVAHIRLRKTPSRVKEMILADPPRLVFDIVYPGPPAAVAKKPAPKPAPEAVAPPKRKPAAPPLPVAKAPEPKPAPAVVPAPAPKPAAKPTPPAPAVAKPPEEPMPAPTAVAEVPEAAPPIEVAPEAPRPALPEAEPRRLPAPVKPAAPKPTPRPAARPAAKAPAGRGIDWMLWGGVAAGVLLLVVVFVLWLRRRALPSDIDVSALAEEAAGEGAIPAEGFAMGEEPVASALPASDAAPSIPDFTERPAQERQSRGPEFGAGPGLFDDDPEKESDTMDTESPDRIERTASELPTQMGVGAAGSAADADVTRLVRELERRLAQVETRLDESIDARERLERQVAAQAEELRVQRAAIARTQRALRSLNRGEEEQATEPALREPNK